jgi:signal transduction histidine kinase
MNGTGDHITLQRALASALPQLASILALSKAIHVAIISSDGFFSFTNNALAKCLKLDSADLLGRSFSGFLTSTDAEMLSRCLSGADHLPEKDFLLNIVARDQIPHTLRCRIAPADDLFILVAESPRDDNQSLQEDLLQLNNQLVVLSRENVRKGRALAGALSDLKKAQSMLVHQEKIALLGQMTAGIAHEINNPLAFVLNNEQVLRRDFGDLQEFVNTIREALPQIAVLSPTIHADIIAKAATVGLEYLSEAVPGKISANIAGLERIKKIILDLRNFSRLDEAERKLCYLTEGIESTLRFLGYLMKERGVGVETCLAKLPQVLCSPGPLNQAISNIVVNAIQASRSGQSVRVTTREDGDFYSIEVTDQGAGIPTENLGRVFEPFFTTKPVGSGTGLGLSIARQIVDAQGGRLEIQSVLGSGTTVRILLPRKACNGDGNG